MKTLEKAVKKSQLKTVYRGTRNKDPATMLIRVLHSTLSTAMSCDVIGVSDSGPVKWEGLLKGKERKTLLELEQDGFVFRQISEKSESVSHVSEDDVSQVFFYLKKR